MIKRPDNGAVGRAGEYLALSKLSYIGCQCTLAQVDADDAYIKTPSGLLLTLQVKTSNQPKGMRRGFSTKLAKGRQRSDVFAFVSLDIKRIIWVRGDDPRICKTQTHFDELEFYKALTSMEKVLASYD